MKAPEVKNRKKAEHALFRSFDPQMHFWAQKSLFEHFEPFLASREPMKHRPGAFWPKSCVFYAKMLKNAKSSEDGAIFDLGPPKLISCSF